MSEHICDFLSKFNTEDEIDNEIARLYRVIRKDIPRLMEDINFYKNARPRGMEMVEINPSIIDKLHPSIIDKLQESHTQEEYDFSTLPGYINHMYKSISGGYNEDNIWLKVYAIYRHRKELEKKYKKILDELNQELGTNLDETTSVKMIIKEKIILLYEKLVKML